MKRTRIAELEKENEELKTTLKQLVDDRVADEKKIHRLASPYISDIISEAGQKTLPMIVEELKKEVEKYKRAIEIVKTAHWWNGIDTTFDAALKQAEQEASDEKG